jgi:alpha-1,2-glucosyltransferase
VLAAQLTMASGCVLRCCRYFTVPFVLLALHMRPPAPWQLAATGAAYAAVDAATVYVFLFRPFTWPDGSVARFMW